MSKALHTSDLTPCALFKAAINEIFVILSGTPDIPINIKLNQIKYLGNMRVLLYVLLENRIDKL